MLTMRNRSGRAGALWAPPRSVVVTQVLLGLVMLAVAVTSTPDATPSAWDRFNGLAAAVVAGLAFGVAASMLVQGGMVRRHMEAEHPGEPIPRSRRG